MDSLPGRRPTAFTLVKVDVYSLGPTACSAFSLPKSCWGKPYDNHVRIHRKTIIIQASSISKQPKAALVDHLYSIV